MDYTIAGFTFHFSQNDTGNVVGVIVPSITVGPFQITPQETLKFDPALTVEQAQQVAAAILMLFGLGA